MGKLFGAIYDSDSGAGPLDEEGGEYRRRSTTIKLNESKIIYNFVAKTLVIKVLHHALTLGYTGFVLMIAPSVRHSRNGFSDWFILVPLIIWCSVYIMVNLTRASPSYIVSGTLVLILALSVGFIISEVFRHLQLYAMFLPVVVLCLALTNLFFIPCCIIRSLRPNLKRWVFLAVPQILNLIFNGGTSVAWMFYIQHKDLHTELRMRNKTDAILLLVVPTLLWTSSLNLLMATQLRKILRGQLFFVSQARGEYVFASLYFL